MSTPTASGFNNTMQGAPSKARERTLWALQIAAALFFAAAAISKLAGAEYNVVVFEKVGLGQWFRYFTGIMELTGVALIVTPRLAALGGAWLSVIMVGAFIADRFAIGGNGLPALVALIVTATVAWLRWPALRLPGKPN